MPSNETIAMLKHVFDEVKRKQRKNETGGAGIEVIVEEFNDLLQRIQEETDSVENIQEIETVDVSGVYGSGHPSDLEEILLKTHRIVEALDLNRKDFERIPNGDENLVVVNIEQSQRQQQQIDVSISFEDIRSQIQNLDSSEQEKEQLDQIAREFREETESEGDQSRLKDLYRKASSISKDIAAQLVIYAIVHGVQLFI